MDVVLHVSRLHGFWQSLSSPRSSLGRNASTSFRTISQQSNSHLPETSLGSWMRSALFPLSIQDGCCRSREPTVWRQLIAGNVYARRANRIDPVSLLTTAAGLLSPRRSFGEDHVQRLSINRFLWRHPARSIQREKPLLRVKVRVPGPRR